MFDAAHVTTSFMDAAGFAVSRRGVAKPPCCVAPQPPLGRSQSRAPSTSCAHLHAHTHTQELLPQLDVLTARHVMAGLYFRTADKYLSECRSRRTTDVPAALAVPCTAPLSSPLPQYCCRSLVPANSPNRRHAPTADVPLVAPSPTTAALPLPSPLSRLPLTLYGSPPGPWECRQVLEAFEPKARRLLVRRCDRTGGVQVFRGSWGPGAVGI